MKRPFCHSSQTPIFAIHLPNTEHMVLDLIHKYKEQYKTFLATSRHDELFLWESLRTFQDNWNLEGADFKSMYARSFANTLANDLWEGQHYYPKKAMLELIDQDSNLTHGMFSELFNENLDIGGRIDRFVYHCDELSRDMMRSNPKYQNHYHDGYRMISVYLAFQYPMQYTIYSYPEYKAFMALIKARDVPGTRDIGRFFKVMRTVYSILAKDEELIELHRELRAGRDDMFQGESLLLVRGFYWFCGGKPLSS